MKCSLTAWCLYDALLCAIGTSQPRMLRSHLITGVLLRLGSDFALLINGRIGVHRIEIWHTFIQNPRKSAWLNRCPECNVTLQASWWKKFCIGLVRIWCSPLSTLLQRAFFLKPDRYGQSNQRLWLNNLLVCRILYSWLIAQSCCVCAVRFA